MKWTLPTLRQKQHIESALKDVPPGFWTMWNVLWSLLDADVDEFLLSDDGGDWDDEDDWEDDDDLDEFDDDEQPEIQMRINELRGRIERLEKQVQKPAAAT